MCSRAVDCKQLVSWLIYCAWGFYLRSSKIPWRNIEKTISLYVYQLDHFSKKQLLPIPTISIVAVVVCLEVSYWHIWIINVYLVWQSNFSNVCWLLWLGWRFNLTSINQSTTLHCKPINQSINQSINKTVKKERKPPPSQSTKMSQYVDDLKW